MNSSLSVQYIQTPSLRVAYEHHGPADGEPVILLHGFPYDPRSYDEIAPELAARGYRVIVPYLRGYGPTRFAGPDILRSGQQAALAQDLLDLMDALEIPGPPSPASTGAVAPPASSRPCGRSGCAAW